MHFAPETVLIRVLQAMPQLDCSTTDLLDPNVDLGGEDIQRMSFPTGAYDLVLCNHVLEHVPDDLAAIKELARILSPHGIAVITVPGDWRRDQTMATALVHGRRPSDHLRHYGRDIVQRLASSFASVVVFDMHRLDQTPDGLSFGVRRGDVAFICRHSGRG